MLLALGLTLTFDMLPRAPLDNTFDPSWAAVLSYAHQKDLQFGTDIVFTYGPLGFAANPYFTERAAGSRLVLTTAFSFLVAAGVCLWAWRLRPLARILLLSCFAFAAANVFRQAELCYQTGLLCWGLLCFSESGRGLLVALLGCTLLAIFGVLAKFTFLFAAGGTVLAVVSCWFLRRQWLPALGATLGFFGGAVVGWLLLGQGLGHILSYLRSGIALTSGYGPSMFFELLVGLWRRAVVVGLLGIGSILVVGLTVFQTGGQARIMPSPKPGGILEPPPAISRGELLVRLIWLSALLFLAWKYGAIIPDREHLQVFFGFMPVLVLALQAAPLSFGWLWLMRGTLAGVCLFISLTTLQWLLPFGPGHSLAHPLRMTIVNLKALVRPSAHLRELSGDSQEERARQALPALRSAVGRERLDVFGSHASYALVNGLNYSPRPVFQSYAAYSEPLMRLNEEFYLSKTAPPYVLFELAPLTRRLPALEDALVLRDLLINYRLVQNEGPFLLLSSNGCARPKLTLLRQRTAHMGEPIPLTDFGATNLWMEIQVEPSWRGRLREFAWQTTRLRVGVWRRTRPYRTFRAPTPMLAAGFLASPLLLTTEDVAALYAGQSPGPPEAYSVEVNPGTEHLWRPDIQFRLYAIAQPLGRH